MARCPKPRFWRLCRVYFRHVRMTVWLIILAVLGVLIYLNQVGLPGFVKRPLLEKLRARGLDLQFARLRVRFYQGIVADNVRFGSAGEPLSPQLTLREVQVELNGRALRRFQLQVDALKLRQGRLVWPLAATNQAPRQLSLENIETELRFLPNDQWALDHFKANFLGGRIQISGTVTNASAVRDWKFFQAGPPAPGGSWQNRLCQAADALERVHFSAPPDLRLDVRGDASDLQTISLRLLLVAPGADTPWGAVSEGRLSARLFAATNHGPSRAELSLEAVNAQTRWADITNFQLGLHLSTFEGQTNLLQGALDLSSRQVQTPWGGGTNLALTARWIHAITNPIPLSGFAKFQCDQPQTKWAGASQVQFSANFATPASTNPPPRCDDSWGWWTNLQPYLLDWECHLTQPQSPKLQADEVACGGTWRAPELTVTNLQARLYHGQLAARAGLDVATRALQLNLSSDFAPQQIASLLTEDSQRWLDQFSWPEPPQLKADIALVLPAWTNRQPDWRREVQPALRMQGEFNLPRGGTYHQVQFTTARSHFSYSNLCWHLPDLTLTRPEGGLAAEHRANDLTKDYYWHISSTLDPRCLRPLLETNQQRGLDSVAFSQPPVLDAEIRGRFHDHASIGLSARVGLTNFTFRGETASSLQTTLRYTNRVLQFFDPRIERGTQHIWADGVLADFNAQAVYLTNGFSTAEPMVIARAIGEKIGRTIEPYQFSQPPVAHVHGTIPMHGEEGADLHFDLDGGPFHWWKFNVPHIVGHVHWAGEHLVLSDMRMDFYEGKATGSAAFDFDADEGTDFQFSISTTDILLQALMADLSPLTNHLEGRLVANLTITKGNTADWRSVDGSGSLALRDGLIWDIPLFGVFTPVLNGISPGLGNSRASAATCGFVVTNGIIRSDDLEIRSPAMRLEYRGTVALDGHLNARVEAELLRDMWLLGPLVSTVFWPVTKLFEYKVTGVLSDPKTEPLNPLPKLILMPFHPFRTFKGPKPDDLDSTHPNAPPFKPNSP
ncbi:MAG TPA: AsmA-like C-terminal region-containing protein [Candidatus Binatia bacterium]|jgi:hypothetical protein|nr:AsmA-like C-terminal region-containing protein [Candidatus Binatia bacterium]